jgi:hypothetical protein
MVSHPPAHTNGPGLTLLPFGGLGLDLAEVRRKVSGLLLTPFRTQEAHEQEPRLDAPPVLSGYGLLLRLCRETLGS